MPAFITCKVLKLHGNMEQEARRTSFQGFNSEKTAILLCTDIAARGLDFPKVRYIIQYDSPGDAIEYVHRYFCGILWSLIMCVSLTLRIPFSMEEGKQRSRLSFRIHCVQQLLR